MFGISRQSSGFWIAVAIAFGLGYFAASLSWDAEAQPGICRSADVDNDVPPIVGMGNPTADDGSPSDTPSDSLAEPSAQQQSQ